MMIEQALCAKRRSQVWEYDGEVLGFLMIIDASAMALDLS